MAEITDPRPDRTSGDAGAAAGSHGGPPPSAQMVAMLGGFQVSQALYVVARLDLATKMADGPRRVEDLAATAGAHPESLRRLLRNMAGFGLFTQVAPDTYAVTPLGATLASDTPGSVRDLALTWMETHYAPFSRLVDTVRTGEPAADQHYGRPFFDWLAQDPDQVARFTGAMGNLTGALKVGALAGYRLPDGAPVADIGGADGALLAALLHADPNPRRRGIVFDLPHVVPAAHKLLADEGLADRVDVLGGDFFREVPAAQVYLLSMIVHDWDDAGAGRLLTTIAEAAAPGARLVCLELVVPPGDGPHLAKMIDLTMLGMLTGKERTGPEITELFDGAGFRVDRIVDTPTPMSIVEATRI